MATRRERVYYELSATDSASQVFRQVEGSASRLRNSYQQLTGAVGALASAGFIAGAVRAAVEAERAQNRLAAVIKATGGAAGIATGEYDRMAESLAEITQFDDESLRNAQATLLKFGNIHGEVFRGALKISADLAAFMGTDVPEAAQMVGKSLQSPTEGLAMMERQFGKLAPAQEKHINDLVRQGKALEAQNAVLDLWAKKVGGAAQTMNVGLGGALSGLGKGWNELLENFGKTANSAGLVERAIRGLTDALKDLEKVGKGEDPMVRQQRGLDNINRTIETLERDILERRNQRRAYGGGGTPDDPRLVARLEQLRAQRHSFNATLIGQQQQTAFETSLANAYATPPIVLGGKVGEDEAAKEIAKRAEELQAARMAAARDEEAIIQRQNEARIKEIDRVNQAIQKSMEEGLLAQEKAMEERDDLERSMKLEKIKKDIDAAEESARRFDDAINTAFDRAVRGGGKFMDVLKKLGEELINIEIQKRIFAPASKAIGAGLDELFKGMFSGAGGAQAGAAVAGVPAYAMGTDYVPRTGLALVHQGERITPAGENVGGVTVVQHNTFGSGIDEARLEPLLRANREQTKAEIQDALSRGNRRYAAP